MRNLECIISEVLFNLTRSNAKCEKIISPKGKEKNPYFTDENVEKEKGIIIEDTREGVKWKRA